MPNLLEDSSSSSSSSPSPPSPSSSSYRSRLLIRQIRRPVQIGDIDSAVALLQAHAPAVLDDRRLFFRLQKQALLSFSLPSFLFRFKFIELLRGGTPSGRDSAIECLRTVLAPCALDAYPEAYEEFKHVLLAFIFDKEDNTSPVANEVLEYLWSEKRSIHKVFCFHQGVQSPISDLTERLLLEERDPPATPQESLYEVPPFDEVDIQALAHAVELTRQGAVDSLKFAKGDLFQAFQNELCRMKLNAPMLDELVHEYCIYRGIVDGDLAPASASGVQTVSKLSKVFQPDLGSSSSRDGSSLNLDCGTSRNSDGETSVNNIDMGISQEVATDSVSNQGLDAELRYACEAASNRDDCSTSETHQSGGSGRRSPRSRNRASGESGRRKRWRGRFETPEGTVDVSSIETGKQGLIAPTSESDGNSLNEEKVTIKNSSVDNIGNREDQMYEIVLEMRELAHKGMAAEVVEEVNAVDPNFFEQNPVLLFQLKQVEFLKLVNCGDHAKALRVACSYLGPLATSNPPLLKPLKETLLALLRPTKSVPLSVLATSLQVAMGRRLGIEEPQLMKIMRAALHTHTEWFKLQMCKDRFEGLLNIDYLKEIDAPFSVEAASKTNAETSTHGSSQVTVSSGYRMPEDGSSPTQVSSGDVICDETAILKVMEFLALPRADAIHLLAQYNGNAETVIQQIFA
ncbi:hypothetical protein ACLOJK_016499 [Asimina triloba]